MQERAGFALVLGGVVAALLTAAPTAQADGCCSVAPDNATFVLDRSEARPGEVVHVTVHWNGNPDTYGECKGAAARLLTEGGGVLCERIRPMVGQAACREAFATLPLLIPYDLDIERFPFLLIRAGLAFPDPWRWYCDDILQIQILPPGPPPENENLCSDDCNENDVRDWEEICENPTRDCNVNGILDECEMIEQPLLRVYVDPNAVGAGNGSSWEDAYPDLQLAIRETESRFCPSEFWIAAGVYQPAERNGRREATFLLEGDARFYGGFLGHEEFLEERNPDPETNGTVLCGDLNDDDAPGRNRSDNVYHVVSALDPDSVPLLDGFTIRGGNATDRSGAGILIEDASPVVRNCVFEDNGATHGAAMGIVGDGAAKVVRCNFRENQADLLGGAINIADSHAEITDCVFTENRVTQALGHGGAIYNFESSPVIRGCRFTANGPSDAGGAISNWQRSSPIIADCRFERNSSMIGGGIMNFNESNPIIENCVFQMNIALEPQRKGGGIYSGLFSNPTVSGCMFLGNSADRGGAMYNRDGSDAIVVNCAFVANQAVGSRGQGGCVYNLSASPNMIQCTFTANSAMAGASVYNTAESFPTISNSILFSGEPGEIEDVFGADTTVTFSTIRAGHAGEGNIDAPPRFLRAPDPGPDGLWGTEDDDDGDLRLAPASPGIDAANNEGVPSGVEVDLLHMPRFVDDPNTDDTGRCGDPCTRAVVDMGANEFQVGGCMRKPQWVCDGDVDGDGQVNPVDAGLVQAAFGSADDQDLCNYDVDCDGQINPVDAGIVQSLFGTCESPREPCP